MQKPSDSQWTILDLVQWTTTYFKSRQIDSPRLSAELLLAHVLDINRIDLYLRFDQPLAPPELAAYRQLIKRRVNREPMAYITGRKDFWDLSFSVDQNVLIPRPETEFLVEAALERIPREAGGRPMHILELGTGSGAVIISIAAKRPAHLYFASDADCRALAVARENARRNQAGAAIRFFAADWLAPLSPRPVFDLIVSNPPYIPFPEIPGLAPEICRYEPAAALDGGPDGLSAISHIIDSAPLHMRPGGTLLLEIGDTQRERVERLLEHRRGVSFIRAIRDYGGWDRVVEAACRA